MSSDQGVTRVSKEEVEEYLGSPMVHVEGVERGPEVDTSKVEHKEKHKKEPKEIVHEGDSIKTAYSVEEDTPPSFYEKLKGKVTSYSGQLMPKDRSPTEAVRPNDLQSSNKPTSDKHGKDKRDVKAAGEETTAPHQLERFCSTQSTFDAETTEEKKVEAGDELGTGYEESSENSDDVTIPPTSTASVGSGDLPKQSESLFKPVEAKDESELTLESLRASKLNQNSSAEDVKAPGVMGRAMEEVDALSKKMGEELGFKQKPTDSTEEKEADQQGGLFSRIADKIGYGSTHGRSQST